MQFDAVIRGRRSIRRFKPDPVPLELVREILDEARWSPSWANTQAWSVYVVTGESLERLKGAGKTLTAREAPAGPDFRMPREWPPHLAARTKQLLELRTAFAPGESSGLAQGLAGIGECFGAPCMLFFAVEEGLESDYVLFDNGLLVQSVCLAAHDKGLGTCIMAMAVRDPDTLRELLPHSNDSRFVIGVALGYPDEEAPINRFERQRVPLEEFVTWTG
jgi:nitroreductase